MSLIDKEQVIKEMNTRAEEEYLEFRDIRNMVEFAPTVKAIPVERLKDFRNEVMNMNSVAIIQRLDKLIAESEDTEKRKPCINYEDGCEDWNGCPCVYYNAESEE